MASYKDIAYEALKLFNKVFGWFGKKKKEKKEILDEAKKEIKNGIKKDDPSKLTAGFDAINRNN